MTLTMTQIYTWTEIQAGLLVMDNTSRSPYSSVQSVSVLTNPLYGWQTTTETSTLRRNPVHLMLASLVLREINDTMTPPIAPQDRLMWTMYPIPLTITPTNILDKNANVRSLLPTRTPHRLSTIMPDAPLAPGPVVPPPPPPVPACTPTPLL